MGDHGIEVTQHHKGMDNKQITGKPNIITKKAEEAIPGCDMIVFVLPALAFEQYLHAMKDLLEPGMSLVAAPGQAGFEFEARSILGDKYKQCTVVSFETLPWACRASAFGRKVDILGQKSSITGAIEKGKSPPRKDPVASLQYCIGPEPKLIIGSKSIVAISLKSVNAYIHPPIFYGTWEDWDGTPIGEWEGKPIDQPPKFYHGINEKSFKIMEAINDEVVEIAQGIQKQHPETDMSAVKGLYEYYMRVWAKSGEIADTTNLFTVMKTMAPYETLRHPMTKTTDGKFLPDFNNRYVTEDIPFGLLVIRGIAETANIPGCHAYHG